MIKKVEIVFNTETQHLWVKSNDLMDWEVIGLLEVTKESLLKQLRMGVDNASTDTSE